MPSKVFYLGKWQVIWPAEGWETPSAWQLPKTTEDLHETSNVEELDIIPEDMFLTPENTQAGCDDWAINLTTDSGEYSPSPLNERLFYPGYYPGTRDRNFRYEQPYQIAPSFFYTIPIESGSRAGERTVLDFT
jgi:hypothetical protein